MNYYARFLPHLATKLAPLYRLLQKQCPWEWPKEQEDAFIHAKSLLQSTALLVHYEARDASPYGVGAVLSHVMGDGSEKPIGYVSRTLSSAEKGYLQLDKEALSIVLVSPSSIHICMGDLSLFFQTTGLSCICWGNIKPYL